MDDQPTCGKGLAAQAPLPATLGELMAAMAGVLAEHQHALDLADEHARLEHQAYATLAAQFRKTSDELAAAARQMLGYQDLPMGRHDEARMGNPEAVAAFERFVESERTLVSLLSASLGEHEAMLAAMR